MATIFLNDNQQNNRPHTIIICVVNAIKTVRGDVIIAYVFRTQAYRYGTVSIQNKKKKI